MRCHPLRRIKFALAERIKAMVAASPDTLAGKRDRALVLLGFAGAFRRSELVALRVADVDESQAGLRVIVRHSKTDQEGEGATVAIARGAVVCPVKALREWLEAAGISNGSQVFRWNSPKVSGLVAGYSRFAETIGGDWRDHDCRPRERAPYGSRTEKLSNES